MPKKEYFNSTERRLICCLKWFTSRFLVHMRQQFKKEAYKIVNFRRGWLARHLPSRNASTVVVLKIKQFPLLLRQTSQPSYLGVVFVDASSEVDEEGAVVIAQVRALTALVTPPGVRLKGGEENEQKKICNLHSFFAFLTSRSEP